MRFVERLGFRELTFRGRLTLVAAAAVAVTTIAASVVTYFFVQSQLVAQIDNSLRDLVPSVELTAGPGSRSGFTAGSGVTVAPVLPAAQLGGAAGYAQLVDGSGQRVLSPYESVYLPATARDQAVAHGNAPSYFHDEYVGGKHVRVLSAQIGTGLALQVARPMDEVDGIMAALRLLLIGVAAGGILLAALLSRLVARAALAPVQRLSEAVEHVTATSDLTRHVPDGGSDELSRLAANFNRMLAALDHSLRSQRQLVADASHELRTPLASLRTNVEALDRAPSLPVAERKKLLQDLVFQSEQLTRLVHDLIDLARDDQPLEAVGEVQLDALVAQAVERAASHWPQVKFIGTLEETVVTGDSDRPASRRMAMGRRARASPS